MKRISTLTVVLSALLALPLSARAEEAVFDFQNNPQGWPVSTDVLDETGKVTSLTVDGVTLSSIQGDSYYPNIILSDEDHGTAFFMRRNTSVKLAAPEGKALTKVEVTMQSGSFDPTPSTGALADNVWTGNAAEVTFAATGARYIWKMVVTLADENGETVKPATEEIEVEAADIAAFNAAADGKIVKLTLTNARVNGKMGKAYFVEDATGATELPVLDVDLKTGDVLNGYIVGAKASDDIDFTFTNPVYEYTLKSSASTSTATFTVAEGTLEPATVELASAGVQDNFGRLVTLADVAIEKVGSRWYAKAGEAQIELYDGLDVFEYGYDGYPEKAKSITGIIYYNFVRWAIMPISEEAIVADTSTGLRQLEAATETAAPAIYNLQGVRLAKLQRGVNIVNGKKVVVK